jgi:hypothetical protein
MSAIAAVIAFTRPHFAVGLDPQWNGLPDCHL